MAWVVTDQTGTANTTGATLALTIPTTIAIGSLVVVGVTDSSVAASGGSMTDSGGNTYTSVGATALNSASANGFSQLFYSVISTGLTGGSSTITYTKQTSGAEAAMSALSATGNAASSPLDTAVTATQAGFGGGGSSLTSGTPSVAGELFVGWFGNRRTGSADPSNGWLSPPLAAASSGAGTTHWQGVGANQVNAGIGTILWQCAVAAGAWAAIVIGFKPPAAANNNSRLLLLMGCGT